MDFDMQQRAAQMERKEKERKAREDLNRPVSLIPSTPIDAKAAEMKAMAGVSYEFLESERLFRTLISLFDLGCPNGLCRCQQSSN